MAIGRDGRDVGVARCEKLVRCGAVGRSELLRGHGDHEVGLAEITDEVDFVHIKAISEAVDLEAGAFGNRASELDVNLVAVGVNEVVGFENLASGGDAGEEQAAFESFHFGSSLASRFGFFGGNRCEAISEVGC